MGNNAAFTSFEASVLACYNKGVLDKELLDQLAEPYRDSDIDRGGMTGDLANDELDINGIILKIYGVKLRARPKLPANHKKWTIEQELDNEKWCEEQYEALQQIEDGWGWR